MTGSLYPRARGGRLILRGFCQGCALSLGVVHAKRCQPVLRIHEFGLDIGNPGKAAPGPLQVADPVVQICERVPQPEVVLLRALGAQRTSLKQADGVAWAAFVRQRARSHDAPLGDRMSVRIGVPQPVPDVMHVVEPAQCPVTVREHRQLVDSPSERLVLLEPV